MAKDEQHGFDVSATARRLEDWFLDHVAFPAGAGMALWPGGRTDAIHVMLMAHWSAHVGLHSVENDRCGRDRFDVDRRALGAALARLEIRAYEVGSHESKEIHWLRQAALVTAVSASTRAELLALADQIAQSPISRAVMNSTAGRPRRLLADAVAQQLRAGGFSYGKIANLMESTEGAARWRCRAEEARSLANVFGACP